MGPTSKDQGREERDENGIKGRGWGRERRGNYERGREKTRHYIYRIHFEGTLSDGHRSSRKLDE